MSIPREDTSKANQTDNTPVLYLLGRHNSQLGEINPGSGIVVRIPALVAPPASYLMTARRWRR
jgi:hypothetical protein